MLPFKNSLLQSILTSNTQMAAIVVPRDVITKVNSLGKDPDRPVDPVAVIEDRLGDPPLAEAIVEGGKG
jgi:hypothetical protein